MVATKVFELVHVPPATLVLNEEVTPVHRFVVPVIPPPIPARVIVAVLCAVHPYPGIVAVAV